MNNAVTSRATEALSGKNVTVRQFRQILLWPLQLMPLVEKIQIHRHWEFIAKPSPDNPWREVADEFTGDPRDFQERHYAEFVNFLPYVQRVLYGKGKGVTDRALGPAAESSLRVFRRSDVQAVRIQLDRDSAPVELRIAHVDLYFFFDLDIVIPVIEVFGADLDLATTQDILFRFGRAYPPYWDADGRGGHCPWLVEWLGASGEVLARSDYERRERYLTFVCEHRSPTVAAHWEWLLRPMVQHHSSEPGSVRYRQLEYHRLPTMGYLAVDEVDALTRADWVRLGLVTAPGDSGLLPYSERHVADFEQRYCFDRYFQPACGERWLNTRLMCSGHSFVMVGRVGEERFTNLETGLQGQFRHQYFLVFLIAHFQKAGLLMLSDRLIVALSRLDIQRIETVKEFKRSIRQTLEIFLRFNHRYWFHEISNQVQLRDLYKMLAGHLGSDALYCEVRDEVKDMSAYLESDTLRRQANTVVRLTVVTVFGLIGTVLGGIFGMNLFDFPGIPMPLQVLLFVVVGVVVTALLFYTLAKSKALADFLDSVSDTELPTRAKFRSFFDVWRKTSTDRVHRMQADVDALIAVAKKPASRHQ
ncbi:MAG TPA: CorA family divalent cation transporter [Burkholderiaceae bacterium]|nr:CorA family divalent cation transporter [Burkholderiaceae bacterium]